MSRVWSSNLNLKKEREFELDRFPLLTPGLSQGCCGDCGKWEGPVEGRRGRDGDFELRTLCCCYHHMWSGRTSFVNLLKLHGALEGQIV